MTPEEKFLFDLEGYLVVKDVLTAEEVAEMNKQADVAFPPEGEDTGYRRQSRVSERPKSNHRRKTSSAPMRRFDIE